VASFQGSRGAIAHPEFLAVTKKNVGISCLKIVTRNAKFAAESPNCGEI